MESLKGKERTLELQLSLPQKVGEILNEAGNSDGVEGDQDEAAQSKKMKQDNADANEQVDQQDLMNFEEDSTEADAIATTKVLRNPMLLLKILKGMEKTSDVFKNCRLVNLDWRDLSTDILLLRRNLKMTFSRYSKPPPRKLNSEQQQHFSLAWGKRLKLSQLTRLIPPQTTTNTNTNTSSYRFPCVDFTFEGDLNCADAQEFLNTHGKNIKLLKLSGTLNLGIFRKLLVEQAPNLESLNLNFFQSATDASLFPEPNPNPPKIQLPFLTCFETDGTVGGLDSLLKEIVEGAPNLENCKGIWHILEIQDFLPRLSILKQLSFIPQATDRQDNFQFWERAAQENLHANFLELLYTELDHQNPAYGIDQTMALRVDGITSKLLEANRTTLKKLDFWHSQEFECRVQWPEMERVEELVFKSCIYGSDYYFDDEEEEYQESIAFKCPTLEISQHFPNLKTLMFCSVDTQKSLNIFKGRLLSLDSLEIARQPELFNECYKTFPNISRLVLSDLKDDKLSQIAPIIWTVKPLKTLHLDLKHSTCSVEEVDAVFTGMEENTCEFLRTLKSRKLLEEFGDSEIEKWRVRSSILNLTELQELVLLGNRKETPEQEEMEEEASEDEEEGKSRGPSSVSFEYAFKLMPKLKVQSV